MLTQEHSGAWWSFGPLRNALLAGVVAGVAFALEQAGWLTHAAAIPAYVASIPLGSWHWVREGWEEFLEEGTVGIEVLMMAATIGAAVLGLWDEAAALVVLYGAAEGLEELAFARTRASIRSLLDLAPKEARLLKDGAETTVRAKQLKFGDQFVVRPGEGVVTDGIVVGGRSSANEAAVTGESMPVEKAPGSTVFAGTINGEGALTVQVTAAFDDNTLSRIIHLVEEAQERKGRAQQWIERFGRRYSPAVLVAAGLLFAVPTTLLGLSAGFWAERAVVLLVAAAPCALIMSMPMAMASAIGSAGRRGILIKGGAHLEHLGRIRTVAFDKTGTLTLGRPVVTDVVGTDRNELLRKAASVEHLSQHPIAQAIVREAASRGLERDVAEAFRSITGGGAKATIGATDWLIGSPDLLHREGIKLGTFEQSIAPLQTDGKTVIVVAANGVPTGLIAVRDQLRPDARAVVNEIHRRGLKTVILTGDNLRTAQALAREIGIDDVRAELKPEGKVRAVHELASGGSVLMIGDGVNDAPALAAATCGIALGAGGTDAAIEAADVALLTDDLMKITEALDFGNKARRVSAQNIVLSLMVLASMIPLAVIGLIGVATAVAVHESAELLAVANGLRAGRVGQGGRIGEARPGR